MKEIILTQGKVALVDDDDFDRVNMFKWHAMFSDNSWYAVRKERIEGRWMTVLMHRFIFPGNRYIDHRDCNGLNNQKQNLRPATNSQNHFNSRKYRRGSSRFKGVWRREDRNCWAANLRLAGETIHLGMYESEEDAAHVYDYAAETYFGEFARLNFPE